MLLLHSVDSLRFYCSQPPPELILVLTSRRAALAIGYSTPLWLQFRYPKQPYHHCALQSLHEAYDYLFSTSFFFLTMSSHLLHSMSERPFSHSPPAVSGLTVCSSDLIEPRLGRWRAANVTVAAWHPKAKARRMRMKEANHSGDFCEANYAGVT